MVDIFSFNQTVGISSSNHLVDTLSFWWIFRHLTIWWVFRQLTAWYLFRHLTIWHAFCYVTMSCLFLYLYILWLFLQLTFCWLFRNHQVAISSKISSTDTLIFLDIYRGFTAVIKTIITLNYAFVGPYNMRRRNVDINTIRFSYSKFKRNSTLFKQNVESV